MCYNTSHNFFYMRKQIISATNIISYFHIGLVFRITDNHPRNKECFYKCTAYHRYNIIDIQWHN